MSKVRFGLSNVHIAILNNGVYGTPVKVPGAVNLTADPQGDQNVFYADNVAYYTTSSNAGYTGDLEMALIPDVLLASLLGWEIDSHGMIVEVAEGVPKSFALLYEVSTDEKARRNVFYNCTLARPSTKSATGEQSTTVSPETYSLTMISTEKSGKNIVKAAIEPTTANQTVYDAWYTSVTLPDFVEA